MHVFMILYGRKLCVKFFFFLLKGKVECFEHCHTNGAFPALISMYRSHNVFKFNNDSLIPVVMMKKDFYVCFKDLRVVLLDIIIISVSILNTMVFF